MILKQTTSPITLYNDSSGAAPEHLLQQRRHEPQRPWAAEVQAVSEAVAPEGLTPRTCLGLGLGLSEG